MSTIRSVIHPLLNHPAVFALQEQVFNNYEGVGREFADCLTGSLDILDIGCSTGVCAGQIIDFTRHRYTGIDIDPNYISFAAQRHAGAHFSVMDCRELRFPEASFDRALFVGVLHHLSDEVAAACFQQLTRVVRPDGRVLVAEPLMSPDRPVSYFFLKLDRGKYIRTARGYESLFSGFSIERAGVFQLSFHRFAAYVLRKQS